MHRIFFEHVIKKISQAKERADYLTKDINHPGITGQIREIAVNECITPFLTHSFSCGTGKVIDSLSNTSDQLDLIIYQNTLVPSILIHNELGFFPVECCKYVFEIKSKLTATELKDALKKAYSIFQLKSFPKEVGGVIQSGNIPITVLFAFDSDLKGCEIQRYLKYDSNIHPLIRVIVVLGKGYWYWGGKGEWIGVLADDLNESYEEFACFMTGFTNTLAEQELTFKHFSPGKYIGRENNEYNPVVIKGHSQITKIDIPNE